MSASSSALVDAVGWALVHSTWQVSVLACGLWLLLRLSDRLPSSFRYTLCVAGLFTAPVLFLGTVLLCWDTPAVELLALEVFSSGLSAPSVHAPAAAVAAVPANPAVSSMSLVVSLWALGVLVFGVRFLGGLVQVRSLRLSGHRPVSAALQERVRVLALSLGIDPPVSVVESLQVTVPMVVGIIRPLILLPSSALVGLTPEQLESVLLHELAHIRRRDLWVSFVQGLVEVVLFFHPAMWWMSSRLRAERELCCDDVVLERGASAMVYARALLSLSEQRRDRVPSVAAAATDGSLRYRIERLVGQPGPPQRSVRGLAAIFLFCCFGLLSAQQSLASDDDLTQMVDGLLEMEITLPEAETSSIEEMNSSIRTDLGALMVQHRAIHDRMAVLMADDPDRWGLIVALRSAQVDEHIPHVVESSDIPPYLTEQQAAVYQAKLMQRSAHFRSGALDSYQQAAAMSGPSMLLEEARSGLLRLQGPALPTGERLVAALEAMDTDTLLERASATGSDDPSVGHIWLMTAERLFDGNDAARAIVWYTAALEHLSDEQAIFARYKVAWCHYNMGHEDNAITTMEAVVEDSPDALQQEALKDLVRFYISADRSREGRRRFIRTGNRATWDSLAPGIK